MINYIHGIPVPDGSERERTPEEKFEARATSIDNALTRTDRHGETYDWERMKESFTEIYKSLNPRSQDKYARQYTDLIEEIESWQDLEKHGFLNHQSP